MTKVPAQRVTELELKLAHQEQALEDLSDMVTRQWQVIDRLEREVRRLSEQLVDLEGAGKTTAPKDAPPPHY
jgi:SlyX protein